MIAYILKVTLCWLFFYGIYELFLKKKTFFTANRSYLLITLLVGVLLPLLEFIPWKNDSNVAYVIYPLLMEIDDIQAVAVSKAEDSFNFITLLYLIYAIGFIISLIRLILGISKIVDLYRISEKINNLSYILVLTDQIHLPFSFFKWVFMSKKLNLKEDIEQVIEHEIEHIKGRHSIDILLTEALKVVFWCSPMIYFYKNALKEIHEFLADNIVIKKTNKISYKKLLLNQTNNGLQMALTHQFFNSHLKNRLKMINQKRSGRPNLVMYAFGIPVLLLLLFAFTYSITDSKTIFESNEIAEQNQAIILDTVPGKSFTIADNAELFKVVEEMPRFPGCEDIVGDEKAKEECSKQKMLEFIYKNIKYPSEARSQGIEGINVVQFVVTKSGDIANIKLVRDIGGSTGEQSTGVVEMMNSMPLKWIPGKQRGQIVNVQYTLPIRFALDESEVTKKPIHLADDAELFKIVEEMPRFPGCEDIVADEKAKEECSKQKMLEFIYKNIKYPSEARSQGIEGINIVQFVVTKSGDIANIKLLRDIGGSTGEQSTGVVEMMNSMPLKWIPGKQRGQIVNVQYTLPIKFKLSDDDASVEPKAEKSGSSVNVYNSNQNIEKTAPKAYIVVDDKPYNLDLESIDPEDIESVNILKGAAALQKYGEKGKNGVIEIRTKSEKIVNDKSNSVPKDVAKIILEATPLYIVDEVEIASEEFALINPDEIQSISVLKGESAREKYGEKGVDGVIEITSKAFAFEKTAFLSNKNDSPAYFPGCSTIQNPAEKIACSNQKLLEFIYSNLKYPKNAKDNSVEGLVVSSFLINLDGSISDIKLKRDLGFGTGNEVIKIVELMNSQGVKWEPAIKDGKAISMEFTLPVNFKLEDPEKVNTKISDCDQIKNESERMKCRAEKEVMVKNAIGQIGKEDDKLKLILKSYEAFPNPNRGIINLKFEAEAIPVNIQIVDFSGKVIWKKEIENFNGIFNEAIELDNAYKGVVLLHINQNNKIISKKIIVD